MKKLSPSGEGRWRRGENSFGYSWFTHMPQARPCASHRPTKALTNRDLDHTERIETKKYDAMSDATEIPRHGIAIFAILGGF